MVDAKTHVQDLVIINKVYKINSRSDYLNYIYNLQPVPKLSIVKIRSILNDAHITDSTMLVALSFFTITLSISSGEQSSNDKGQEELGD